MTKDFGVKKENGSQKGKVEKKFHANESWTISYCLPRFLMF